MHIALDFDDVVLDFVGNLVNTMNTEYDAKLTVEDITEWDLSKAFNDVVGEDWWDWWERRDWLWAQAPAVPGAIGGIERLRQQGHYLEIVTAKPRWAEAQTWRWLGKWRPPVHRVTILPQEQISQKSQATDAEVLVDDKPENVMEFIEAGRSAVLFDRPHNRMFNFPFEFALAAFYAYDWNEVLDLIGEIENANQGLRQTARV